MLTPIIAIQPSLQNPGTVGAETANAVQPQPRGPVSVSPLQSEVVMKIVDTLSRHFLGRDVLPPEALARLVETLAQVLKVPPLPNETTMEFARRLAAIVETMPPEIRSLAEKQLGLRPFGIPARVLVEALRNPNGSDAARIATVLETAPQAANGTGGRLGGPLVQQQAGPPVRLAAALAAVLGSPGADVEALQSILKATYGQEERAGQRPQAAATRPDPQNGTVPQEQASGGEPVVKGKIERLTEMLQKALVDGPLTTDTTTSQQLRTRMQVTAGAADAGLFTAENDQAEVYARTAGEAAAAQRPPSADTARTALGTNTAHAAASSDSKAGAVNLAGALANLPEETIDALVERLSKALKTIGQATPAQAGPAGSREETARLPARSVPVAVDAEPAVLPPPEDAAGGSKPVKQAAQMTLPGTGTEAAERKDAAANRPAVSAGPEESRHDMNLPLRAGEPAVVRDIIPFAILHYFPAEAEAEAVSVPEEEEPAFPSEEDDDGEAADNGDGDEAGGEDDDIAGEALDESAATVARVIDSEADDTADDEAYQAYIRMGGIL